MKTALFVAPLLFLSVLSLASCSDGSASDQLRYAKDSFDNVQGAVEELSTDELMHQVNEIYREDLRYYSREEIESQIEYIFELTTRVDDQVATVKKRVERLGAYLR